MKTLPVHTLLRVQINTLKTIGFRTSKALLSIPFSRQSLLLIAVKKAPIATLNTIVINSLLKGLFHPAFLSRVISSLAFVVAIFMAHQNGDNKGETKRRHVKGMLDETDPLTKEREAFSNVSVFGVHTENGSFSKCTVFTAEQCERKAKTDKFYSVFI